MKVLLDNPSLRAGAIFLVTLAVYLPAMQAGFIWDDDTLLTNNSLIKAEDGLYRFWFTREAPDYFPLTSTSLWLEWRLWGMNAAGYHVVNILLHASSSVLLWLVLKKLRIPGAWLAGLIFAVHPVNVESVAWITQRKNTLPMVFYLLTILFYLGFQNDGRARWYVLSLCSFLLALLAKTSVIMTPFVLLGCVWWQQRSIVRRDLIRVIPFFIMSALLGLVTIWFQYRSAGAMTVRVDDFWSRLATAGRAVWFYLSKAVIPDKLTFVYPRWETGSYSLISFLPLLALLVCFLVLWRYRASWGRALLFGFGYFVVTLVPVLGFLNIYYMKFSLVADHWQYTAIIGIIALAVGGVGHVCSRWLKLLPSLGVVAAALLIGIFSMLTWRQSRVYTSTETLWHDTIAKNPDAWLARAALGYSLAEKGEFDGTIEHFSEAARIKPEDANAHYNLGVALSRQGRIEEAVQHYSEAVRIKPDYAEAHNNLGILLAEQGRLDGAIAHFSTALRIKPNFSAAKKNLERATRLAGETGKQSNISRGL
jgi:tetratricopeptide (TPR) repeat protein